MKIQCGTKIRFIAWRDSELQQDAEGVVVKICNPPESRYTGCMGVSSLSSPHYYVRFPNGEGLYISTWDVIEVIGQNNHIPLADENGGVWHESPDVVTNFFNRMIGR